MNEIFTRGIEKWYSQHGRHLPWRETRNPYSIWISEIILQQTRVAQGMDYYHRFLEKFPTVEALAAASEDEVLRMWQGLGYYSRARNLHAASKQIVEMGHFPDTYESIRSLRGVGDYTAAAIASISFGLPCAVLDGNVYRVLSRYLGQETPIDTTAGQKLFRALADEMLDPIHPALYNQAIMDFGALQCTPQNPLCLYCPLNESCAALATGKVDALPVKIHKTKVRDRYFSYLYMETISGEVLIQRRDAGDIWEGLYQLPLLESSDGPVSADEMEKKYPGCKLLVQGMTHQLSHQLLHADCYHIIVTDSSSRNLPKGQWVKRDELENFAMPKLLLRILEKVFSEIYSE
ncbi:MAG: A/G-specific adenine glycosylase [Bacteroidaceae bacterium]|nr:A/G-specific adenine glycosylase [Bacteroidaceae bacterium]